MNNYKLSKDEVSQYIQTHYEGYSKEDLVDELVELNTAAADFETWQRYFDVLETEEKDAFLKKVRG